MRITNKQIQWLIGAAVLVAGLVVGLVWRDTPGIVIGAVVSFLGVLTAFWFEINELSKAIESSSANLSGTIRQISEGTNEKIAQSRDSVIRQLEDRTIPINPQILSRDKLRADTTQLLCAVSGMDFLMQTCILSDAAYSFRTARFYPKHFPKEYQEELRVSLLADVINHASDWVYAFSHADPDHIDQFWNVHKNTALPKYLLAHEDALKGPNKKGGSFHLRRVFVMPDDLPEKEPATCRIFCDVLENLIMRGMTELYVVNKSQAEASFRGNLPKRSFFAADDRFISQGKSGKLPKKLPYAKFTTPDDPAVSKLKDDFQKLMNCVSAPVSLQEIQVLRLRCSKGGQYQRTGT